MLKEQLLIVSNKLKDGELNVSDGLLIVARCLRPKVQEKHLVWLNRELLGYRPDDLIENSFQSSLNFGDINQNKKSSLASEISHLPTYRFLTGIWGKVNRQGKLLCVRAPRLASPDIFCNLGIQQIETNINDLLDPSNSLFCISSDNSAGAEFYCYTQELYRIYEAVRERLCLFIEGIVAEVKDSG